MRSPCVPPALRRSGLAAGAAAFALAACGGGGAPAAGVVHLEPRLADGGSPAAALAAALATEEIRPDPSDPGSIDPWRVEGGLPTAAEGGGLRLLARADELPRLVRGRPFEAADKTALELLAHVPQAVDVAVAWRGSEGADRMVLPLHPGDGPRTVRFALAAKRSWRGTISELHLTPSGDPSVPVAIHAVRLLPGGFRWGHEPLREDETPGAGGPAGDAGLRAVGRFARRAWPADLDVPLFASVETVPRGGLLAAAVAPGNDARGSGGRIAAAVDARREGGAWAELARAEIDAGTARWWPIRCDLGAFAGGPVELRFRAHAAGASAAAAGGDARPRREALLWGAPEVLGELPESRRPNLVLITLDTTRADALGTADPVFAPFMARLAEESLVFEDAWSTSNATSPSHASLLTGLHVEEHGVVSNRHLLGPSLATIAESLRAIGYHTAAAVSAQHVQAGTGFGQGFDEFALAPPGAELDGAIAAQSVQRFVEEWRALPPRPFFLWVHLFDPHMPYSPPEAFVEDFLERTGITPPPRKVDPPTIPIYVEDDRPLEEVPPAGRWRAGVTSLERMRYAYKLGVAYADHLCERIYAELEDAGLLADTALILTADHGESLGEHNVWFDHQGLFRETLQVPLYLRPPGGTEGRRVATRSSGIDVVPTLRALAGLPPDPSLEGVDLRRLAEREEDRRVWFVFSDMHQAGFHDGDAHFFRALSDRLRLGTEVVEVDGELVPRKLDRIPLGEEFLYDPAEDPGLVEDVSEERPEAVATHAEALRRWRESLRRAAVQRRDVSPEEERNLRDMGYAGD